MIPYFALDREFEALRDPIMARVEEVFESGQLLQGPWIAGFERNAEESESGWAVVIKATGEKLPVSRRQHHVVKQFR